MEEEIRKGERMEERMEQEINFIRDSEKKEYDRQLEVLKTSLTTGGKFNSPLIFQGKRAII